MIEEKILLAESYDEIIKIIMEGYYTEVEAIAYYLQRGEKDIYGHYIQKNKKFMSNLIYRNINSITKKLKQRYTNEIKAMASMQEDIEQQAIEIWMTAMLHAYTGRIDFRRDDINIPKINIDQDELNKLNISKVIYLKKKLSEESNLRLHEYKKLFTKKHINYFLSCVYTHSIQYDFNNFYKQGNLNNTTSISYGKDSNNKTILKYNNFDYISFDQTLEGDGSDENLDMNDFLNQNPNVAELQADIVQPPKENSNKLYEYILANYFSHLTDKQKTFFNYALNQEDSFLKRGDENYSYGSMRTYKNYIVDKIINEINITNDNKVIVQNGKLKMNSSYRLEVALERLIALEDKSKQVDMLLDLIQKDNRTSELICELLIDADLYKHVMEYLNGSISSYKLKVIYLPMILNELAKKANKTI